MYGRRHAARRLSLSGTDHKLNTTTKKHGQQRGRVLIELLLLFFLHMMDVHSSFFLVRQRHGSHRSSAERLRQRERRHLSEDAQRQRCAASAATGREQRGTAAQCVGQGAWASGWAQRQSSHPGEAASRKTEKNSVSSSTLGSLAWSGRFFSRYPRDMAGYGGIYVAGYRGIPRDTGEISGDKRYGEIRGDAIRCEEMRGRYGEIPGDRGRYRKRIGQTRATGRGTGTNTGTQKRIPDAT